MNNDVLEKMGFDTLDITKLGGQSSSLDNTYPCLKQLAKAVDYFIELNTCTIKSISFSKDFDLRFHTESNQNRPTEMKRGKLHGIRTLVGDASVVVRQDQEADVVCYG